MSDKCDACGKTLTKADINGGRCTSCLSMILPKTKKEIIMSDWITNKKYVAMKGVRCPHCNSENIEGTSFEANENGASQEISCSDCEESWIDTYKLTGYMRVK